MKVKRNGNCIFFSAILYTVHLPHIPSYSLLLYRKEISAALYAAVSSREGASPVKPPPEAEQKDESFY